MSYRRNVFGLALMLGWGFFGIGLRAEPTSAEESLVNFLTLAEGHNSGIASASQAVISRGPDWAALWTKHVANVEPKPDLPKVDFANNFVAVLTLGQKPTGGFSIRVTAVVATKTGLEIRYTESAPGPCELSTNALTTPFHIVQIPKPAGGAEPKVRFVKLTSK